MGIDGRAHTRRQLLGDDLSEWQLQLAGGGGRRAAGGAPSMDSIAQARAGPVSSSVRTLTIRLIATSGIQQRLVRTLRRASTDAL